MKKKLRNLSLILLLLLLFHYNSTYQFFAFHPFFEQNEGKLKVMTWNIHNSAPDFKEKEADVAQLIIDQDADVVLLNEFYQRKEKLLDSTLSSQYPHVSNIGAKVLSGDILYSRYPILRAQRIHNDTLSPLTYEFLLQVNNDTLRIVGCHLVSTNNFSKGHRYTFQKWSDLSTLPDYFMIYEKAQMRRIIEAQLIRNTILSKELPTIVMGDCNDFSSTPPLQTMEEAGVKDAWWNAGTGLGCTFHEGWMHFRLDHILYNDKLTLQSLSIIQTDLSDHQPMVAEFDYKQIP